MNAPPPEKERRSGRGADPKSQIARKTYSAANGKKQAYKRQLTLEEYLRLPRSHQESLVRLEHKDSIGRVVGRSGRLAKETWANA
jgi:hypothetical protein